MGHNVNPANCAREIQDEPAYKPFILNCAVVHARQLYKVVTGNSNNGNSLQPFLQKLAAKGQSDAAQALAAESVKHFHDLVRRWKPRDPELAASEQARSPWEDCLQRLKEEIRLRQYSRKTFQTYADIKTTLIYTHTVPSRTLK
ncbi:MAG TPA: hypothetical protein PKE12_15535 [Kiritimatiellia bacterium]|nr:hypothetical protein [Kiritimatiellia bacterium]